MYKTLPDFLTINKSDIHGLGIFATQDIPSNSDLGISHIKNTIQDLTSQKNIDREILVGTRRLGPI